MQNIHASCVEYQKQGILFLGASGFGKSDLCLRMIMQKGAVLVADDRVDLEVSQNNLLASAPLVLKGLLEVRGIGIIKQPFVERVKISLVVELVRDIKEIGRMPVVEFFEFEGILIKKIKLYAFEFSALEKIICANNAQDC